MRKIQRGYTIKENNIGKSHYIYKIPCAVNFINILVIKVLGKQSNIGYFLESRILLVEEFI